MSTGKIELSVGAIKIGDKHDIFTEEEVDAINKKIPELDKRVGDIEDDIEEINNINKKIPELDERVDVVENKIPELDERVGVIEDEIEEINSSLDNKASKNEVFSMANMGQDIKEAMTGGSVAVVGKNAILTENIVDGQITGAKTDFFNVEISPNIFDEIWESGNINSLGNLVSDGSRIRCVNFIDIIEGQSYTFYRENNSICEFMILFYKADDTLVSSARVFGASDSNNFVTITIPTDKEISKCKLKTNNLDIGNVSMEVGKISNGYFPKGNIANSIKNNFIKNTPISQLNNDVGFVTENQLGGNVSLIKDAITYPIKNILTPNFIENSFYHKTSGSLTTATNSRCTELLSCQKGDKFLVSGNITGNLALAVFYDSDKKFLGSNINDGSNVDTEITIPNNCCFVGFSTRNNSSNPLIVKRLTYGYINGEKLNNINSDVEFNSNEENDRLYALERRIGFKWKPFDNGKIIFMTDDTLSDISTITELLMDNYNFPMSYACITNTLNNNVQDNSKGWKTVLDVLKASQSFGGEVWSHSIDSNDMSTNSSVNGGYNKVPIDVAEYRFRESKKILRENGLNINGFVSPRGVFMDNYLKELSKYYRYAYRGSSTIEPYLCTRINIKQKSLSDLKIDIDNCAKNKNLLILMCHNVVDTNGEGYGIYSNGFTLDNFKDIMNYIKSKNDIDVTTMRDLYNQFGSI